MNFQTAAQLGSLLAKVYAEDIFELLVNYKAISASEVAARLDLHIKTAQDFLEGLVQLGILSKEEALEQKRPYYRYSLKKKKIEFDLDLSQVKHFPAADALALRIRERENAGARFAVSRSGDTITSVTIWTGEGREREERRIKLTTPQGRFLFHLPFPKAEVLSVKEIMHKANLEDTLASEVLDLVQMLAKYKVIESEAV
jgi:predicted transcriptional regulator